MGILEVAIFKRGVRQALKIGVGTYGINPMPPCRLLRGYAIFLITKVVPSKTIGNAQRASKINVCVIESSTIFMCAKYGSHGYAMLCSSYMLPKTQSIMEKVGKMGK